MARKTEAKTIGEYTYEVTSLGALQGRKLLARVAKVLGPAFQSKKDPNDILVDVFKNVDDTLIDYICDTLAPSTTVAMGDRKPRLSDIFDAHFAGNYQDLMAWLMFALQVNFSSFLAGNRSATGEMAPH